MSNVAASGGYYISFNADRILANPLTVTGSIGVVGGKFNCREFFEEKIGITFDSIKEHSNSDLYSIIEGFSKENEERYNYLMDTIYADFKNKIVRARSELLTGDSIEKIAKGRVWMGTDAHINNLVDELGGLTQAINATKLLLDTDSISLKEYPRQKSIIELIFQKKDSSKNDDKTKHISRYHFTRPQFLRCKAYSLRSNGQLLRNPSKL